MSNQSSTQIQVIVSLKVKDDQVEEMRALMTQLRVCSRKAPGNVRFDILECLTDPTSFTTCETWKDTMAADVHMGSAYVEKTLQALGSMLASDPSIIRYSLLP